MRMLIAIVAIAVGLIAQTALSAEPPRCPVMPDEYAEQDTFAEYEGRKVYLCCERCRINFTHDAESYVMNLASVGQAEEFDWSTVGAVGGDVGATPQMSAPPDDPAPAQTGRGGVAGVFGRSHVVWVHFPIACLVIAGVIRLGALIGMEGTRRGMGASGMLLVIGAVGAAVSAGTGLVNPQGVVFEGMQGVLHETFDRHKLLGLVLAGLCVAAVMAEVWSVRKEGGNRQAAHGAVVVCGVLAVVVAHLGGTLVHGPGFLMP